MRFCNSSTISLYHIFILQLYLCLTLYFFSCQNDLALDLFSISLFCVCSEHWADLEVLEIEKIESLDNAGGTILISREARRQLTGKTVSTVSTKTTIVKPCDFFLISSSSDVFPVNYLVSGCIVVCLHHFISLLTCSQSSSSHHRSFRNPHHLIHCRS